MSQDAPKRGDWLRCTLPKLTAVYGCFCQVEEVPRPDLGQGVRVAFPPMRKGWKPYRTSLDHGHWVRADDAVTLLGRLAVESVPEEAP